MSKSADNAAQGSPGPWGRQGASASRAAPGVAPGRPERRLRGGFPAFSAGRGAPVPAVALAALVSLAALVAAPLAAEPLGLGRPATEAEIAAWNIDVRPDGQGLPEGQGDVATGEELFNDVCAACHGDFGEGLGLYPALAGGEGTLTTDIGRPVKSIGSFVPYLSTIFDFVHRAKPFGDAQSYTDDEVYALVAYLLYLNDLVDEDFILSRENFTAIRLPNEGGFFLDDRATGEVPQFSKTPCMTGCKPAPKVTSRAIAGVTPEN